MQTTTTLLPTPPSQATLMSSRHVHSLLTPGRVVQYLNPITGLTELAMVCGGPEHVEAASASRASRNLDYFLGSGGASSNVAAAPAVPDRKLFLLVQHSKSPMDVETPQVQQKEQNGGSWGVSTALIL